MPFASSNQRTYRDCHPERSVSERAFSSAREQDPRDLLRCTQGFLDHVYIYLLIVGYQLPREPGDPQSRFLVPTRALVNARARFTDFGMTSSQENRNSCIRSLETQQ